MPIPDGIKTGTVPSETDVQAARPERLSDMPRPVTNLEVFALATNTDIVRVGGENTVAVPGRKAGIPLVADASARFGDVDLMDVWLAVEVDGEGVYWIADSG